MSFKPTLDTSNSPKPLGGGSPDIPVPGSLDAISPEDQTAFEAWLQKTEPRYRDALRVLYRQERGAGTSHDEALRAMVDAVSQWQREDAANAPAPSPVPPSPSPKPAPRPTPSPAPPAGSGSGGGTPPAPPRGSGSSVPPGSGRQGPTGGGSSPTSPPGGPPSPPVPPGGGGSPVPPVGSGSGAPPVPPVPPGGTPPGGGTPPSGGSGSGSGGGLPSGSPPIVTRVTPEHPQQGDYLHITGVHLSDADASGNIQSPRVTIGGTACPVAIDNGRGRELWVQFQGNGGTLTLTTAHGSTTYSRPIAPSQGKGRGQSRFDATGRSLNTHINRLMIQPASSAMNAFALGSVMGHGGVYGAAATGFMGGVSSLVSNAFRIGEQIGQTLLQGVLSPFGRSGAAVGSLGGQFLGAGSGLLQSGLGAVGQGAGLAMQVGGGAIGAGASFAGSVLNMAGGLVGGIPMAGALLSAPLLLGAVALNFVSSFITSIVGVVTQGITTAFKVVGDVFGKVGELAGGILKTILEVAQDSMNEVRKIVGDAKRVSVASGVGFGSAFGMTQALAPFGAQGVASEWFGSPAASMITPLRFAMAGMPNPANDPMGALMAQTKFYGANENNPLALMMNRALVPGAAQMDEKVGFYGADRVGRVLNFEKEWALDPKAMRALDGDLMEMSSMVGIFASHIKALFADALRPFIMLEMPRLIDYMVQNKSKIVETIQDVGKWLIVELPILLMKFADGALAAFSWFLKGAYTFLTFLSVNYDGILSAGKGFLSGLGEMASWLAGVAAGVSQFFYNLLQNPIVKTILGTLGANIGGNSGTGTGGAPSAGGFGTGGNTPSGITYTTKGDYLRPGEVVITGGNGVLTGKDMDKESWWSRNVFRPTMGTASYLYGVGVDAGTSALGLFRGEGLHEPRSGARQLNDYDRWYYQNHWYAGQVVTAEELADLRRRGMLQGQTPVAGAGASGAVGPTLAQNWGAAMANTANASRTQDGRSGGDARAQTQAQWRRMLGLDGGGNVTTGFGTGGPGMVPYQGIDTSRFDAKASQVAPYANLVAQSAASSGLTPQFVASFLDIESRFRTRLTSSAGAEGIAQIMPMNFRGHINPNDPGQAIPWAANHMALLKQQFSGPQWARTGLTNDALATAGYNWGSGNMRKWLRRGGRLEQMPNETQRYLHKMENRGALSIFGNSGANGMSRGGGHLPATGMPDWFRVMLSHVGQVVGADCGVAISNYLKQTGYGAGAKVSLLDDRHHFAHNAVAPMANGHYPPGTIFRFQKGKPGYKNHNHYAAVAPDGEHWLESNWYGKNLVTKHRPIHWARDLNAATWGGRLHAFAPDGITAHGDSSHGIMGISGGNTTLGGLDIEEILSHAGDEQGPHGWIDSGADGVKSLFEAVDAMRENTGKGAQDSHRRSAEEYLKSIDHSLKHMAQNAGHKDQENKELVKQMAMSIKTLIRNMGYEVQDEELGLLGT